MGKKEETVLVKKIIDRLQAEGGFWFKVHGGPFQLAGIPDILGCYKGRFVGIEVKCEGNTPTRIQQEIIDIIRKNKGYAGVAYTITEALSIRDGGNKIG